MGKERRGMLMMLCCAIMWSLSGVLTKLTPWNAFVISAMRSAVAALVLYIYIRATKGRVVFSKMSWLLAIDVACIFMLYMPAVKLTSAANAIVLQYTAPIYVLLFCALFYKQKVKRADILAVALTFAGIALFFMDQLAGGSLLGNLMALCSGVFLAGMFLLGDRVTQEERLSGLLLAQLLTVVAGVPFMFFTTVEINGTYLLYILIHGVVQLGVPYLLYTQAVRACSPLTCSLISVIEPLLNPIWVFLALGESPSPLSLVGMAVVLITITLWCVWSEKQKQKQRLLQQDQPLEEQRGI